MCETALVKVEVKESIRTRSIPEPVLLILSPPPPFSVSHSQPGLPWPKWLKDFERYTHALKVKELPDSSKLDLLQKCLGPEGEGIFKILVPNESSYAAATAVLTSFFSSSHTSQVHRLQFHQRAQGPEETLRQFVSALEELAVLCRYRRGKERAILDQLIRRTNSLELKERLLNTDDLTLASALAVIRELEPVSNGNQDFGIPEVSVDIVDECDPPPPPKPKRGRPRKNPCVEKTPQTSQTLMKSTDPKDNFYYRSNRVFHGNHEDHPQRTLASDSSGDDKNRESSLLVEVKQEESSNTTEDEEDNSEEEVDCGDDDDDTDDEDEDFVLHPSQRKRPACTICPNKFFPNANKLARHMRTHTQEKPFACPLCDMIFSQSYHMTRHMRAQHGGTEQICPFCGETLENYAALQKHKKTHKTQVLFCLRCNKEFSNIDEFSIHIRSHIASSSIQGCRDVTEKVKTEDTPVETEDHLSNDDDSDAESVEEGSTVVKNATTNPKKGHYCPICPDRRFKGSNKLARHMRMHTKEKPFSCPVCEKTFSQSYHMTRHLKNLHGVIQPQILFVNDKKKHGTEQQKGKETHTSQVLICLICNGEYTDMEEFSAHVRSHSTNLSTKTQDESCDQGDVKIEEPPTDPKDMEGKCQDKMYDGQSSSNDDSDAESVEEGNTAGEDASPKPKKGHYCPICPDRRFKGPNKLARHMRMHTKEKPFTCPVCEKTFSQSHHMTRHLKNLHGVIQPQILFANNKKKQGKEQQKEKERHTSQVLICLICNDEYTNMEEFSVHVRSHSTDLSAKIQGENCDQGDVKMEEPPTDSRDMEGQSQDKESDGHSSSTDDSDAESMEGGNTAREDSSPKPKKEGHYCPICPNRRFKGSNKLARHMRTHTKEKPFTCPVCEMTFSQSYHMTRHVRNQHSLGPHICSTCGRGFDTWLELKDHKKTHAVKELTCFACNRMFREEATLKKHLQLHKNVEAVPSSSLVCGECGIQFRRIYFLKRHVLAVHRKGTMTESFTCPDCQEVFSHPEEFNKHLEFHVKDNTEVCPKCNETLTNPEEFEAHMAFHLKSFSCSICDKKFKVEYALRKHEQNHQHEQYYCTFCCKHFLKLSRYKRHMSVHSRRESKCPHCDSVFLKLTAYKCHLRTHTEERPYQCTLCVDAFETKEDLEQHCLKHRKYKRERPYSCTRCDYAFSTLVELTQHMSEHDGEPPGTCPVCGKSFLNKNKLEKHLSIHNGERPHLCSICGNGFPSAAGLKLHSYVHTGEKPFQCGECGKGFSSSSGLRLHSHQHMDQRPSYQCPQCGRSYGRMTELKMHQRYHTGDKPYACTCCSKRFISKDKLVVHMRTHTGERPYSCPHCGQTFTQTGDRNRHISKQHGNLMP